MPRIGSHQVPTRTLLLVGVDAMAIVVPLIAATALRFPESAPSVLLALGSWAKLTLVTFVYGLSLYFNDLYDFRIVKSQSNLLLHMLRAMVSAGFALALLYFLAPVLSFGRGVTLAASPFIFVLLLSWRLSVSVTNLLARGDERVLVLGTGEAGISLVRHIIGHPEYNIKVVGFLDEQGQNIGKSLVNPCIVGAAADLEDIVAQHKVDRVVLSLKDRCGNYSISSSPGFALKRCITALNASRDESLWSICRLVGLSFRTDSGNPAFLWQRNGLPILLFRLPFWSWSRRSFP